MLVAFTLSLLVGSSFRILWSRFFMEKKMYYVPPWLVVLVMLVAMYADHKSGAFVVGVFLFDLLYFVAKGNDKLTSALKRLINYLMES